MIITLPCGRALRPQKLFDVLPSHHGARNVDARLSLLFHGLTQPLLLAGHALDERLLVVLERLELGAVEVLQQVLEVDPPRVVEAILILVLGEAVLVLVLEIPSKNRGRGTRTITSRGRELAYAIL